MITTSGGGALICQNAEDKNTIMWYATQARDLTFRIDGQKSLHLFDHNDICVFVHNFQQSVIKFFPSFRLPYNFPLLGIVH